MIKNRNSSFAYSKPVNIPEQNKGEKRVRFSSIERHSYTPPQKIQQMFNQQSLPTFTIADINSDIDDDIFAVCGSTD